MYSTIVQVTRCWCGSAHLEDTGSARWAVVDVHFETLKRVLLLWLICYREDVIGNRLLSTCTSVLGANVEELLCSIERITAAHLMSALPVFEPPSFQKGFYVNTALGLTETCRHNGIDRVRSTLAEGVLAEGR